MQYDFLILGGGSAGCVLANRLSENPNNSVCLLEAGPEDSSPFIQMPIGLIAMMRSKKRNWRYFTSPQQGLEDRKVYVPRGKTLGGSSAVNAMIYTRGHKSDYDHWAELGNTGWGWDDVLPVFKRTEHNERGANEFHGVEGGLNVADLRFHHPVSAGFISAAGQAGFNLSDEFNDDHQEDVGLYQVTQKDGKRFSVAKGFLHPIRHRTNLTVIIEARATRILFEGKRAIGAEYRKGDETLRISAKETILCGGAINSPQLLLLSGIGPKHEIGRHGIKLLHELTGVGANLHDHPDALVVTRSKRRDTLSLGPAALGASIKGLWQYVRKGQGNLTSNAAEAGGFIKSSPEQNIPDLQLHLTASLLDNHCLNLGIAMGFGYSCHVCVLRPKSRGSITLASADPMANACIDLNLLDHPDDVQTLLAGVKIVRNILAQNALDPWRGEEVFPGNASQSDEELVDFLKRKADNIYHPVGTCKMGVDEMAVVDPESLRVHGIQGLRVVDASIMPRLIGGNTNAPTVMIADKVADKILAESAATI